MIESASITQAEIERHIELYATTEAQEIVDIGHLTEAIIKRAAEGMLFGARMPWGKTHELFRFRPTELTVWAGENGCGKSLVLGQIMMYIAQTEKVGIISLEMPPEDTGYRMVLQATGSAQQNPSPEFIQRLTSFLKGKLCIYDRMTVMPTAMVLGVVRCLFDRFQCRHVVVDSLSMCGTGVEDRQSEKNLILNLKNLAKAFNGHIHLVAHMRKPSGQGSPIRGKYDIKGDSSISDLVHNVILVSRDWKRDEILKAVEKNGHHDNEEYLTESRDHFLAVVKNRSSEYHGKFGFYSHPSGQFTTREGRAIPLQF